MTNDNASICEQAREYWEGGQPLIAGRLIYERISPENRPHWASSILRLLLIKSGIQLPILNQLLRTAERQEMWREGHRLFSDVRASVLQLDQLERTQGLTKEQALLSSILSVAELVAKVTYNASNPQDPFDADSGPWIAACLRGFVDNRWNDDEFRNAAWSALCSTGG